MNFELIGNIFRTLVFKFKYKMQQEKIFFPHKKILIYIQKDKLHFLDGTKS